MFKREISNELAASGIKHSSISHQASPSTLVDNTPVVMSNSPPSSSLLNTLQPPNASSSNDFLAQFLVMLNDTFSKLSVTMQNDKSDSK